MRQHERNILLNVDLSFKFMRTDTVYDLLMQCNQGNIRKEFQASVIGSIVLTSYNNKTYRIDDVDFDSTPTSTFKKADGTEISFQQYFQQVRIFALKGVLVLIKEIASWHFLQLSLIQ